MVTSSKLTALKRRARKEGWVQWIRSEADEQAVLNGCRFSIERAEHVAEFFPSFLRHSKGEMGGQPFELLDWQRDDLLMPLFGWVKTNERGLEVRRFKRSYIQIPKKNGKSTIAAGVGLYMLVADEEPGAEVYSTANDRKQAGIVHGEAMNMVRASPELLSELKIHESSWTIAHPASRSVYRALSAEVATNEGWNGHCLIVDELHKWRGRKLWDALRFMTRARSQPLVFVITTSGDDPMSVCHEQYTYAKLLLDGKQFDEQFFPLIYEADPTDDWKDPKTWKKANPSFGITIDAAGFAADVAETAKTPSAIPGFKRYSLNIWTSGASPWIDARTWDACQREFSEAELLGKPCVAGLDLSKTHDTTALVLVFPWEDGAFRILPFFWLPRDTARDLDGTLPYLEWAESGYVELTDGSVIDYGFVRKTFRTLAQSYQIQKLVYDEKNAEHLTQEMQDGLFVDGQQVEPGTGVERVVFAQTMSNFTGPTQEFERLILAGLLHHNGQPLMSWQIGNAEVKSDSNKNIRPVKPSPKDIRKIDGVVAAVMGLAGAVDLQHADQGSVYDTEGIFLL